MGKVFKWMITFLVLLTFYRLDSGQNSSLPFVKTSLFMFCRYMNALNSGKNDGALWGTLAIPPALPKRLDHLQEWTIKSSSRQCARWTRSCEGLCWRPMLHTHWWIKWDDFMLSTLKFFFKSQCIYYTII